MTETPEFVEPSNESFWEIGQYKRTVKRCEDGYKLCNDIVQMIAERADLEKSHAKSLKTWSKKWHDYLASKNGNNEYGSLKTAWSSTLTEADKLSDIHVATHNSLCDDLNTEIKDWQKQNYPKSIINQLKTAKEYEEEFKKVQKPWAKKYASVDKAKKDYHAACKSFHTAKQQDVNSKSDPAVSNEQKKKFEDKVEKHKKECEITKAKYKQALDDLNGYNSRYIEDMNTVYKKCDAFEKDRMDFFIQKFIKLQGHLNIYEKMNVEAIYSEFLATVKSTNPDKDLMAWSKEFGSGMLMNWPVFEEYSEELKTIAKGRSSKLAAAGHADNGVTMTSIKHKNDDVPAAPTNTADFRFNNNVPSKSSTKHGTSESIYQNDQLAASPPPPPHNPVKTSSTVSLSINEAHSKSSTATIKDTNKTDIIYPNEQNPFNDLDDFTDEDDPKDHQVVAVSTPIKPKDVTTTTTTTTTTVTKSPLVLKTTFAPKVGLNHQLNNLDKPLEPPPPPAAAATTDENENSNTNNTHHSNSNNSKESNPFGEDDDAADSSPTTNHSSSHNGNGQQNNQYNDDDSDDDKSLQSQSQTNYISVQVKALYDYISAEEDELSFKAGDEFTKIASEDDRGWCLGKLGTKVGLYPATYANNI